MARRNEVIGLMKVASSLINYKRMQFPGLLSNTYKNILRGNVSKITDWLLSPFKKQLA